MGQYYCSVCFKEKDRTTVIAGTVICSICFQKLKDATESQGLKGKIAELIQKENDIYD